MMSIFYIVIAAIAALSTVFGSGYLVGMNHEHATIARLEDSIKQSNEQSALMLSATRKQAAKSKMEAVNYNLELDDAQKSYVDNINRLDQQLDAVKLFKPRTAAGCDDRVPAGGHSGVSEDAAGDAQLTTELDQLVKTKAAECDRVAAYALNAYKFVNSKKGCGIEK